MAAPAFLESTGLDRSESRPSGPVRLRTLVVIRWIAVAGDVHALLLLHYGIEYEVPLGYALAVVGASALLNVIVGIRNPSSTRLGDGAAALYLTYDSVQLAMLLYLTGGLDNPFAALFLAPVAVAATVLSLRATIWVAVVVLSCVSVLAVVHRPLPWTPSCSRRESCAPVRHTAAIEMSDFSLVFALQKQDYFVIQSRYFVKGQ